MICIITNSHHSFPSNHNPSFLAHYTRDISTAVPRGRRLVRVLGIDLAPTHTSVSFPLSSSHSPTIPARRGTSGLEDSKETTTNPVAFSYKPLAPSVIFSLVLRSIECPVFFSRKSSPVFRRVSAHPGPVPQSIKRKGSPPTLVAVILP